MPGTHLFGGMLKNEHFGHFLAESLSRLWALTRFAARDLNSIVFYLRMHRNPVPQWAFDFISTLAPGIPLQIVSDVTIFENLVVPDQAAHRSNGFIYGHPSVRELFERLRQIKGKPFKKLYVSRSRLQNSGGILGEKKLERTLTREGFSVIHPEEHSLSDQIALYNGAQSLIFAEGAALHLFALTCRTDQKVYIIQRRKSAAIFDWQLRSFGLAPTIGPDPPSTYFIPEGQGESTLMARARIDFAKLRDDLVALDMVRGKNWDLPDEQLIREEVHGIGERLGYRLLEHTID
jgi:capsular polysaccharide biosynthesis protein